MPNLVCCQGDARGGCICNGKSRSVRFCASCCAGLRRIGSDSQHCICVSGICKRASLGITVNCVAPGWIDTESLSVHERSQGAATPLRRCGTSREVASCVQWLASESASYITGQTVTLQMQTWLLLASFLLKHCFCRSLSMVEIVSQRREARCRDKLSVSR